MSTLVATLAGAGVAAGVAWLILRRERSDRYRERMYGAMVALAVRYPPPTASRARALSETRTREVLFTDYSVGRGCSLCQHVLLGTQA